MVFAAKPNGPILRKTTNRQAAGRLGRKRAAYPARGLLPDRTANHSSTCRSAIFETHAIYVSADVHDGWDRVKDNCKTLAAAVITPAKDPENVGGHAFAIVGYTSDGFIRPELLGQQMGVSRVCLAAL
jgi:hypothetical protein